MAKAEYFRRPFRKHTYQSEFSVEGITSLPRVDIIYACADMPADLIDGSWKREPKGL
jgi:L-asparaginase